MVLVMQDFIWCLETGFIQPFRKKMASDSSPLTSLQMTHYVEFKSQEQGLRLGL